MSSHRVLVALSSGKIQKMKRRDWDQGSKLDLILYYQLYDNEKPLRKRDSDIKFISGANFGGIKIDHLFAPESYSNYKRKG